MHTLLLVLLAQPAPGREVQLSKMSQVALIAFQEGNLSKAIAAAKQCQKPEPKLCKAMYRWLVEYAPLARRGDELTPDETKTLLQLDKLISPAKPSILSAPVIKRAVVDPLELAKKLALGGERAQAQAIAQQILQVSPEEPEAKALLAP
jgi:hypothetical protein